MAAAVVGQAKVANSACVCVYMYALLTLDPGHQAVIV